MTQIRTSQAVTGSSAAAAQPSESSTGCPPCTPMPSAAAYRTTGGSQRWERSRRAVW
ncbi:hypothetical protein RKD44_001799 [Streptomyces collinus]